MNRPFYLQKWLLVNDFLAAPLVSWLSASSHCPQTAFSCCPPWIILDYHLFSTAKDTPFPLGLHSHEENTHDCISRQIPKMCSYLCGAQGWLVSGVFFTGNVKFPISLLSSWCTLPIPGPSAAQVPYNPRLHSQGYPGGVQCPDTLDLAPHLGLVGRWGHNQVFLALHDLKPVHDVWGFSFLFWNKCNGFDKAFGSLVFS